MAILRDATMYRIRESDTIRWRRMSTIALVSVLVWTVVLGLLSAPRWSDWTSFAAFGRSQRPIALPETSTVVATSLKPAAPPTSAAKELFAPTDTGEAALLGDESAIDSGKPASIRPKEYSSIDAQTLAAARARGEVLGGKRGKVTDSTLSIAAPENSATAFPPAVADEPSSRASGSSELPLPSLPRFDVAQSSAPVLEPPRAALPPAKTSARDSPVGSSQNPNARSTLPQLPSHRAASPRSASEVKGVTPATRGEVTPQPPFEPPRIVRLPPANGTNGRGPLLDASRVAREAPTNRVNELRDRDAPVILGYTRAVPSSPQQEQTEIAGAQRRVVNAHTAPSRQQQDAAAAQLDDSWERRERWLRERLPPR